MSSAEDEQSVMEKELEALRDKLRRSELTRKAKEEELLRIEEVRKEKDEELSELRKAPKCAVGCNASGSFKWNVDTDALGTEYTYSPTKSIGRVNFRLGCKIEFTDEGEKLLKYKLHLVDDKRNKTFAAGVTGKVLIRSAVKSTETVHIDATSASFDVVEGECDWNDGVAEAKEGRLTIEASVKLIYYYKSGCVDFSSPDPLFSNATLVVAGEEFAVNKIFLAHFSKYLRVLFFAPDGDPCEDRFEIPEFEAVDFEDFLRLIYPHRLSKITSANVKRMLHLAAFFDCQLVTWKCIDYLKENSDVTDAEKLELSEQYDLPELEHNVFESIRSHSKLSDIIDDSIFENFPESLQSFIYKRRYEMEGSTNRHVHYGI